ncbi:MAG: FAD-binding protein, partial [Verrucomicrobia bacterium]|nr:FAD-binding protein [Verrucomicrobiota bacterium]
MNQFEFVVLGSGVAGLSLSLKLAAHGSVAIVTKRRPADSNTAWAQGGVACVTSAEDSFDLHISDTLVAGAGLCDQTAVRTIITEGPTAVRELMRIGVHFDERILEDGHRELDLGKEGGHSKRRVLHYHDTTGREIEQRLLDAVVEERNIQILDNHMGVDLITTGKLGYTTEDRVIGVYVLNEGSGTVETIRSDRVIIATGGCGKVYLYTTNPDIATGDGVAMAWRAGAAVANMEFIQFHPTCLFHTERKSFLISEAVRGEGGKLVDASGREFMLKFHKLAALAPRDIVARAIDAEMKRTGAKCMYIDITHKPAAFLKDRFPNIYETCASL